MKFSKDDLKHIVLDLRQMKAFVEDPLVMEKADGVWYWDTEGNKILDGISGIFVANAGHNNKRIIEAMKKQLDLLSFSPPMHATNIPAIKLAKLVSEVTPDNLNTVKILSGGSEATEAAMKLARQYHGQTGNPRKYKVISRYEGFHGTTMGSLAASGIKRRKAMFEPTLQGFIHVPPPTCYRCPFCVEQRSCQTLCAQMIERIIDWEDEQTISAVILEPIGNTGGIITPPPGYLEMVREICDRHNVLLIFDEIITGFGRTGKMFASQSYGVTPDILCMGKGMSSGYAPLSAIAYRDRVADAFWADEEDAAFAHGHTYGGNPLSSTVGLASIGEILEKKLCERAREMGQYLWEELKRIEKLGVVGEIRGKGLLVGVEFVKDPVSKERFDDRFGVCVGQRALKKGLLLRFDPNWVAFAPPLIVQKDEIRYGVDILEESVKEELKARRI